MDSQSTDKHAGLTLRVLLLVLLIAPINIYYLIQMELVRYTYFAWTVPLANVIFILTIVIVINTLISLFASIVALRRRELLTLYVMLSIITILAGCDVLQATLSVLGHGFWFATEENEFRELFWDYLPTWLTVSDREALQGYYLGNSSLYLSLNLRVWLPVVLAWLLLFFVIAFIFYASTSSCAGSGLSMSG